MCFQAGLFFAAAVVLVRIADGRNLFVIARCDVLCQQEGKECKEKCYNNPPEKPGQCGIQNNPFYDNCIHECDFHKDCPNMDLCCSNRCGKTCQTPLDLESIPGLPDFPTNVTISKSSDLSYMLVDWDHTGGSMFIVETKEGSGPWQIAHKTPRSSHPIKIEVQSGIKYEARVAAVNNLGSKGYSKPSNIFMIHLEAKPPDMPENLKFKGSLKNGSVSGFFSWQPARSDQRISRYIVVWTQRIADENSPPHKGSKEVLRKTIPHGKTCIRIKNLKLNSQYTFHVQAQIIFEKKKISSKRATLNILTSNYTSSTKQKSKQIIPVQYNISRINKILNAEISWDSHSETKYKIIWECVNNKKMSAVVVKGSPYTISNLEKNSEYNVFIKEVNKCKKRKLVGKLNFRTD